MILNFAHRGSLTEAPENTLSAFEKALEHGARGIECDVQLTKDKQLVVIHDHHFKRLNKQITGRINDYTLAEIKQIDVGSQFSKAYAGEALATLDEVLELVPPDVVLNIEIKNIPIIHEGIEDILINCLANHHREDNLIISSFDHVALENVQKKAPNLLIGLLFYYRLIKPWEYAKRAGLNIYSVHPHAVYLSERLIHQFHASGYKVFPFTVNQEDDYIKLVQAGVDGVFSNNPAIFGAYN